MGMKLKAQMCTVPTIAIMAMTICSATLSANAQQAQIGGAGVLQPPADISQIISIDEHNSVLIESADPKEYSLALPRYIYSGGVARIFGGTIIPTENFVIPQSAMRSNMNPGMGAPGNFGNFSGFSGPNGANNNYGNNSGNGTFGGFGRYNNFQQYAPRVPVNNMNQFNQIMGYLDRPIRQAQVGADFSNTTSTANTGFGINY
jgi:hypothetical protein